MNLSQIEEKLNCFFIKITNSIKKFRFTSILILLISIFAIPLLLTQCELGVVVGLGLGLEKANEIGDAIGGTLGPYLSFIGSCLLAYTIYLQIRTRKEDKEKEIEKVIFEEVKNELDDLLLDFKKTNHDGPHVVSNILKEDFNIFFSEQNKELPFLKQYLNTLTRCLLLSKNYNKTNFGYFVILEERIQKLLNYIDDGEGLKSFKHTNSLVLVFDKLYKGKKIEEFNILYAFNHRYFKFYDSDFISKSNNYFNFENLYKIPNIKLNCNELHKFNRFFNQFKFENKDPDNLAISYENFHKFIKTYLAYDYYHRQIIGLTLTNFLLKIPTTQSINEIENDEEYLICKKEILRLKPIFAEKGIEIIDFFPDFGK